MSKKEILRQLIHRICRERRIDPILVEAIVWQESNYNPYAVRFEKEYYENNSRNETIKCLKKYNPHLSILCSVHTERMSWATSWGLMQVLGETARRLGFIGAFMAGLCDPSEGIEWGIRYLQKQITRYDSDVIKAISAYNAGKTWDDPLQHEYVQDVINKMVALGANPVDHHYIY